MEIEIIKAPFDASEVLGLIEYTFGKGERELESIQLDGSESEYNDDVVFIAREEGVMLGTMHITIPRVNPTLAGVSGVVTTEAARGKGVGGRLFAEAMRYMDSIGVAASFLGTGNPIAAKMYDKNGYRYVYGTGVMLRYTLGHETDFNRQYQGNPEGEITVCEGDQSLRIPLIPLAVHKGAFVLYDINTDIVSSSYITQGSCMSLYPRYLRLQKSGGAYYFAKDERGVIGAVMSLKNVDGRSRVDFFCFESFLSVIPRMLDIVTREHGDVFFETAASDAKKAEIIKALGYTKEEASVYSVKGFEIPTVRYYK